MPVANGALVAITGARAFKGVVMIVTDIAMIVDVGQGHSVTLRRDPASTKPLQWRFGGLPVTVRAVSPPQADFGQRLQALREKLERRDEA